MKNDHFCTRREVLKILGGAAVCSGLGGLGEIRKALASESSRKVIVLGIDGMDPHLLQKFVQQGKMPNAKKLMKMGGFSPLLTSVPPQSPVAWANFITGMNPGGHGIFDFIHRDPKTLLPYLSTSKTSSPEKTINKTNNPIHLGFSASISRFWLARHIVNSIHNVRFGKYIMPGFSFFIEDCPNKPQAQREI